MPTDNIYAPASTSLSDEEHAIELLRLREELAEVREEKKNLLARMHEPLLEPVLHFTTPKHSGTEGTEIHRGGMEFGKFSVLLRVLCISVFKKR